MSWLTNIFGSKKDSSPEKILGVWKTEQTNPGKNTFFVVQSVGEKISIDGITVSQNSSYSNPLEVSAWTYSDPQWDGKQLRGTINEIKLTMKQVAEDRFEGSSKHSSGFTTKYNWVRASSTEINELRQQLKTRLRNEDAAKAYNLLLTPEERVAKETTKEGIVALQRKDFERALAHFESALAILSDDATLHSNKGVALNELGRYEDALISIERAIALDNRGTAEDWNNKGNALLALGRYDDALEAYNTALKIRRLNRQALPSLKGKAEALIKLEKIDELAQVLAIILAIDPTSLYASDKKVTYFPNESVEPTSEAKALTAQATSTFAAQGVQIVDLRDWQTYKAGHIPRALTLPLESPQFSTVLRTALPPHAPIILVMEEATQFPQTEQRIRGVGEYPILGYLKGGMTAWNAALLPVEVEKDAF